MPKTRKLVDIDGDGASICLPISVDTVLRAHASNVWWDTKLPTVTHTTDAQLPTCLSWTDEKEISASYIMKVLSSPKETHERSLAKLYASELAKQIEEDIGIEARLWRHRVLTYHDTTIDVPHATMVKAILNKALANSRNEQRAHEVRRLIDLAEEHRLIVEGRLTRAARVIMSATGNNELTMPSMPQRQAEETISAQALLDGDTTDYIAHLTLAIANDEIRGKKLHDVGVRKIRRYIRSGTPQTIG